MTDPDKEVSREDFDQLKQMMVNLQESVAHLQLRPLAKKGNDLKPWRDEDRTLKFYVGEFTRTNDVEAYLDWEEALERYFEYKETNDVDDFIIEFENLTLRCDMEERTEQKIAKLIAGFHPDIREKIELQPNLSFEEACNSAIIFDK